MADRLNGYRVLILETREEAQFARLLSEQGADVLQCPMFTINDAPDPVPIEAWIRLTSTGSWGIGPTGCPTIAGKNYKTSYWFGIQCNSDKLLFYAHGLGTNAQSTGSVPVNEWVHVAVSYDSVDVKFYVNGILDSSVPVAGPMDTTTDAFRIGNDVEWNQSPIGDIDEVHFWNVARSQLAIAADMETITTPQIGLVGVWNMEGNPNADVGGFTGTLTGDASFAGTPITTPEPAFLKGDTDCDHQLAASDAMAILSDLAGLVPPLENCENPLLLTSQGVPDLWWDASPGEGYIEVPHSEALNPADAITVELWINVWSYMSHDGADRCNSLAGKGYITAWWLGLCSGQLRFYRGDGDFVDSIGQVPLREWVHVAAVADHTSVKFYINGDLDSEFTNDDAELGTNTDPMRIGSDPNVFVKFKDYAFFVPKDASGRTTIVEGTMTMKQETVEQTRHYLEDAGRHEEACSLAAKLAAQAPDDAELHAAQHQPLGFEPARGQRAERCDADGGAIETQQLVRGHRIAQHQVLDHDARRPALPARLDAAHLGVAPDRVAQPGLDRVALAADLGQQHAHHGDQGGSRDQQRRDHRPQ